VIDHVELAQATAAFRRNKEDLPTPVRRRPALAGLRELALRLEVVTKR